jgi:NitT/TauT family transport system ATP-binding protein
MQQRTALARALALQANVLLMDEPFGSIDAQSRYQLEDQLLELWRTKRSTVLFVTHDVDEAVYLADRVLIMSPQPGRLIRTVNIPLPRPRSHADTRPSKRFGELRLEVWRALNDDI